MKQVVILGGILLVVAVAGYAYQQYSIGNQETSGEPATNSRAILTPLSDDVTITGLLKPDTWKVVREVTEVSDGTGIRTSAQGRAVVANDTQIITSINSNTEMILALSEDKKQTKIELTAGETWSKIERALEQDEVYEVYTPTTVAAVRGTSFGVSVGGTEKVIVTEGTVATFERDPETGEKKEDTQQDVIAGNTLLVSSTTRTIRATTDEDRTEWFFENNEMPDEDQPMVEIDPPVLTIPVTPPPNPAPILPPEPVMCTQDVMQCPDGSFVSRVAPACEFAACPEIVSLPITIDDVSPKSFTYGEEDRIAIYGENLDRVDTVTFNGDAVDFILTSQGVIGVFASDLSDKDEIYDITISAGDESVTRVEAVEVLKSIPLEPDPVILIDQIIQGGSTQLEQVYLQVTGEGMDLVDTALVNGQPVSFDLISATELQIPDVWYDPGIIVEVSGSGLSDAYTLQ